MALPKLLILSFSDARRDPRVYHQVKYLREHFSVTLCGLGNPEFDNVAFLPIRRRRKNPLTQSFVAITLLAGNSGPALNRFSLADQVRAFSLHFDLVLVNDVEPLPLGFALARGAPVVFDAHEYYPQEFEDSWIWRLLFQRYYTRLCRNYMPRCTTVTTVAPGIAKAYEEHFSILPELVYNAPEYQDLSVTPPSAGAIRLVHHGSANPDRGIESMLDMMRHVDARFSLDLMLIGSQRYIDRLKCRSTDIATIRWKEPVPMPDICRTINEYDLGLYILEPSNFNNKHALPNKFFEFIQARLGVAIGPSPEMAAIVNEHRLGVVAENFSPQALATCLNALTEQDVITYKRNAAAAAKIFRAETHMETLIGVLCNAINRT